MGEEKQLEARLGGRKYLFVDGSLHSFADEIGRFTKTSGFHYDVYLHPPRIVHHYRYWEVRPWGDGSFVVNNAVWIYKDHVEDKRGRRYAGLKVPFGAVFSAEELHDSIVEAALKYALAKFLCISADGEKLTVRISFKMHAEDKYAVEPVPYQEGLKLLKEFERPEQYYFLREIGTLVKRDSKLRLNYVVTLHPPRIFSREDPLWGWELKPSRFSCIPVLDQRYGFGPQHVIDEKTGEWYDGISTSTLFEQKLYIPASSVYSAIVEAIAKYVLVKFLGRRVKEYEGKEVVISFESTH
jgi:hypothetical protein